MTSGRKPPCEALSDSSDPSARYRLARLANGALGIFSIEAGEVFHPAVGSAVEAGVLYVSQLRLRERLTASHESLVIWDVGFGAAGNPIAAIDALGDVPGRLCIESFDRTVDALHFGLEHRARFPALAKHEEALRQLARDRTIQFRAGQLDVAWRLHLGDFPDFIRGGEAGELPKPRAIFWDPHSPARNPDMWTLPLFESLFRVLDRARPCVMATYSRSTMVRTAMLLAGFFVGPGVAVGWKQETTVAANVHGALAELLRASWLDRVRRSHCAEPLSDTGYRQAPLSEASWGRLMAHEQFLQRS